MLEPDVSTVIKYEQGINMDLKVGDLRKKYSLDVEHANKKYPLHVRGSMKITQI